MTDAEFYNWLLLGIVCNLSGVLLLLGIIIGLRLWEYQNRYIVQLNGEIYHLKPRQLYHLLHYRLQKQSWPAVVPGGLGTVDINLNQWSTEDMLHLHDNLAINLRRSIGLVPR